MQMRNADCGIRTAGRPTAGSPACRNPQSPVSLLPAPCPRQPRRGMTLIELLAVIVILTTVVAAAIPLMSPNNDDRRLREAARGLHTFISGAQSRAIALNRPFGVALKRLSQDTKRPDDNGVCLEAYYVEQQPPYCGFDANSRAMVATSSQLSRIRHHSIRNAGLVGRLVARWLGCRSISRCDEPVASGRCNSS